MTEHYFTPGSGRRRRVEMDLGGRTVAMTTAEGLFSADGLDHATRVLLEHAPAPTGGTLLDLGCGWGPIACTLAHRAPAADVWAVDVHDDALALTAENAARAGVSVHTARPEDVPADLRFDEIWSNPPIRIGKAALHELLLTWLARLAPDGVAHLVVGRNLGADSLQRWLIEQGHRTERIASSKGFRVLSASARD